MSQAFFIFLTTISARTAIVMITLIAGLRLFGKRQIGQMNIYDLALIMALANAVQNAMTGGRGHLSVGIVSAGTLLLLGYLFTRLFLRVPKLETHVCGSPTILLSEGKLLPDRLHRECVTENQLQMVMRQHSLTKYAEVKLAVLEVDGSISIVPAAGKRGRPDSLDKAATGKTLPS